MRKEMVPTKLVAVNFIDWWIIGMVLIRVSAYAQTDVFTYGSKTSKNACIIAIIQNSRSGCEYTSSFWTPTETLVLMQFYAFTNRLAILWLHSFLSLLSRVAKKFVDDYNFYGGVLHVCYAPEYESVDETSQKLQERKKSVTRRIRLLSKHQLSSIALLYMWCM